MDLEKKQKTLIETLDCIFRDYKFLLEESLIDVHNALIFELNTKFKTFGSYSFYNEEGNKTPYCADYSRILYLIIIFSGKNGYNQLYKTILENFIRYFINSYTSYLYSTQSAFYYKNNKRHARGKLIEKLVSDTFVAVLKYESLDFYYKFKNNYKFSKIIIFSKLKSELKKQLIKENFRSGKFDKTFYRAIKKIDHTQISKCNQTWEVQKTLDKVSARHTAILFF